MNGEEKKMAHGAVTVSTVATLEERHARKLRSLHEAQAALQALQAPKEAAIARQVACAAEARALAEAQAKKVDDIRAESAEWHELKRIAREIVDEASAQIDRLAGVFWEQEQVFLKAAHFAEQREAELKQAAKPFRKQEVPHERRVEALTKRLRRAGVSVPPPNGHEEPLKG